MTSANARFADDLPMRPSRADLLQDAESLVAYLRERLATVPADALADDAPEEWRSAAFFAHGRPARDAAVLAPLYARDGKPYLLFTRRASGLSKHSGEISFPGGGREPADTSLAQTALRESYEELGLVAERVELLGALPASNTVVTNFQVTPFVGWLGEGLPTLRPQPSEVAEVIEAPLAALDDHLIYHHEILTGGGIPHLVHFYDYGAYRIWGFTGRLLNQLLALLPPHA